MKNKIMKYGVFGLLGVVGFVASFLVTNHFTASPPQGMLLSTDAEAIPIDPDALLLNSMASATGNAMSPKEQQLDELIQEVRAKIKDLERRERRLVEREKRLDVVSDQLKAQIKKLSDLKVELATAIGPLRAERQKMLRFRALIASQETENVEAAAKMWEKMDAANAARLVVEMWKTNQQQAATKIFYMLSEKAKAAIMNEMKEEKTLGPEIIRQQLLVVRDDGTL
ncbi:MAG: hypothetical protein JW849_11810 [Phycisphaerae bacterium]|nr:hypothetical protein [Phycisphaerae bacterium]